MKRKMNLTIKIIALTLAALLPFISVFSVAFLFSPEFDGSFAGALDDKLERLYSIEEDKVVIIGGSSAAFGYDSALIEKYLGMPVVNMGLYAALGTKVMLDLTREGIGEGDIVIIAPELDSQTLSMYFNAATTLRALDGSPKYLLDVPKEHRMSLLGASWSFAAEKLNYKIVGSPEYEGIYKAESFNALGDVGVYRKENLMQQYYDPNLEIALDKSIVDGEFLSYLNEYIEYCESVGASVLFEFCPMNRLALSENSRDEEARFNFEKYLRKNLACPVISSIEDFIYDEGYFYDTNLHLNTAGATKHTLNVVRDILLHYGITDVVIEEKVPDPPALPEREVRYFGEEDPNAVYFEYEKLADGSYMITAVKEEYRHLKTLTVPLGHNEYKVCAIGAKAFKGSAVEKLIVTENTNLRLFANGAFIDAEYLSELWMYYKNSQDIAPPMGFEGIDPDSFKVYIPLDSNYTMGGYEWNKYGLSFEYIFD